VASLELIVPTFDKIVSRAIITHFSSCNYQTDNGPKHFALGGLWVKPVYNGNQQDKCCQ